MSVCLMLMLVNKFVTTPTVLTTVLASLATDLLVMVEHVMVNYTSLYANMYCNL